MPFSAKYGYFVLYSFKVNFSRISRNFTVKFLLEMPNNIVNATACLTQNPTYGTFSASWSHPNLLNEAPLSQRLSVMYWRHHVTYHNRFTPSLKLILHTFKNKHIHVYNVKMNQTKDPVFFIIVTVYIHDQMKISHAVRKHYQQCSVFT